MLTFTALITGIASTIFLICGFYLFLSQRRNKNFIFKIFTVFFIASGIQQFSFFLGSGIFVFHPEISNIFWWIAHVFMFIAFGSLIRFPIKIKYPKKEQLVLNIAILYSVIGLSILFLNLPNLDSFFKNGIFNWVVPPLSGAVIGIFVAVISLFSSYIFISEGFKIKDKFLKARSFIFGLGILIYFIGGPMHNFIETPKMQIIASSFLVFGVFLMLIGILLPKIFYKNQNLD